MKHAHSRRWGSRIVTVVVAAAVAVPTAAAVAADGVRTTRALEYAPSKGRGVFTWTQAPRSNPGAARAYLKRPGRSPIRLNASGTKGFTIGGAAAENGEKVAYSQRSGDQGDLWLYDVSTGRRNFVDAVNTATHEYGAAVSGKWLLFGRGRPHGRKKILLHNRRTGRTRLLDEVGARRFVEPGDVTGRWVVWTRCAAGEDPCRIVRYNIRSKTARGLHVPRGKSQMGASVLGNGTVFFGESGHLLRCGHRLRIYRKRLTGERRHLLTLPEDTSLGATSVRRTADNRVALYYDTPRCSTFSSNIYRTRVNS